LSFAALNRAIGTFGLLLLGGRDSWSPEFVVKMQNGVSEGVESEERCLHSAVEVDGGVVGQEGRTEIHIPRHFYFSNYNICVFQIKNLFHLYIHSKKTFTELPHKVKSITLL
jgi:hypothetical protein